MLHAKRHDDQKILESHAYDDAKAWLRATDEANPATYVLIQAAQTAFYRRVNAAFRPSTPESPVEYYVDDRALSGIVYEHAFAAFVAEVSRMQAASTIERVQRATAAQPGA